MIVFYIIIGALAVFLIFQIKNNLELIQKQKDLNALTLADLKNGGKICPPHKWSWDSIKDDNGEHQMWRMVCQHCGPLNVRRFDE